MMRVQVSFWLVSCVALLAGKPAAAGEREGDLRRVNHVVIVMQENHSFDNYFGVLPYAPDSPYHAGPCALDDHRCVDGLTCSGKAGRLVCSNSNADDDKSQVASFHSRNYCPGPDLAHGWTGSHQEANYFFPALTRMASPNDGFVLVNDGHTPNLPDENTQSDAKGESPTEDDTMGYFDQSDLPFYYSLAQTFSISDRYFSSVIGPTFPNRAYSLAATSFGHVVTTPEIFPPLPEGYKPLNGTILDLLDIAGVSWTNYFSDLPTTGIFRGLDFTHLLPVTAFLAIAAAPVCTLPSVSFVDPAFSTTPNLIENDEHPPSDIRNGQFFVSQIVAAVRHSACWKDSIVFITYDEHGGFYDHVAPPRAPQGEARTPDGISPGQCADASNRPTSEQPGGGANCLVSPFQAAAICPGFTASGQYPDICANFDQLGFRVPFIAVSPFSKRHYVSHQLADHTSLLAFIEKRFLGAPDNGGAHLTLRDLHASTLEDLFDFDKAPSTHSPVPDAPAPLPNDPGCPFAP